MGRITIDTERCKGCELCVPECKQALVSMSTAYNKKGYRFAEFSGSEKCNACKLCAIGCPQVAIEVIK